MYIGQEPATSFTGLIKQDFTVSATTSYTLSHSVNSSVDIALYRNFVRQEPETAYTCTGTNLTLSQATVSGDDLYCIYLGQALQTVNPANASVGNSQVAPSLINSQTAETSIADADEVLIYDSSASALRKMTKANFVTGIGGTNTPMVLARSSSGTSVSDSTNTKIDLTNEIIDTDNLFASSRFTVTSGYEGKYLVHWRISFNHSANEKYALALIYKNGSSEVYGQHWSGRSSNHTMMSEVSYIVDMTTNDYLEFYAQQNSGSTKTHNGGDLTHVFITKLIT